MPKYLVGVKPDKKNENKLVAKTWRHRGERTLNKVKATAFSIFEVVANKKTDAEKAAVEQYVATQQSVKKLQLGTVS